MEHISTRAVHKKMALLHLFLYFYIKYAPCCLNIYYFYPLSQSKFNFEFTSFSGQVTRVIITRFICMGFSFVFIKLDNTIL